MGVSCSADRNIKAKINREGIWLEKLESNRAIHSESLRQAGEGEAVKVNLNQPMSEILALLSQYPVSTRLSLSGTIIVARDIAHAKLKELLDNGEALPQYVKDHPIYYAGPAKHPMATVRLARSDHRGRMDSMSICCSPRRQHGDAGERQPQPAGDRRLPQTRRILSWQHWRPGGGAGAAEYPQHGCVAYPELGMEAIWKIEVEDFPAFITVDDKGNDFFQQIQTSQCTRCVK